MNTKFRVRPTNPNHKYHRYGYSWAVATSIVGQKCPGLQICNEACLVRWCKLFGSRGLGVQKIGCRSFKLRVQGIPKGSYVVPFWVCYGFLVRDYNILPKRNYIGGSG